MVYCASMKGSDSNKLDQIIAMLADMVAVFGKRFDGVDERFDDIDETLDEHSKLHAEHTRDLNQIKRDVADNLDKRKQLEVRVTNIEKRTTAR